MDRHSESQRQVLIFGEALVDFFPARQDLPMHKVRHFVRNSGGAPANVSIGLARLGIPVKLLTMVGNDLSGAFLAQSLAEEGVDLQDLQWTSSAPTGITFITLTEEGDRHFQRMVKDSAEWQIGPRDFAQTSFEQVDLFHFGSNLMPRPQGREATFGLLKRAKQAHCLVSMDANLRLHHWEDPRDAIAVTKEAIRYVDLLKVSEEEMIFLMEGQENPHRLYEQLSDLGLQWLFITMGEKGARLIGPNLDKVQPAYPVKVLDTTGAGDGFWAGILTALLDFRQDFYPELEIGDALQRFDQSTWSKVLRLGTYIGSTVCTQYGATSALPKRHEIPWLELGWHS